MALERLDSLILPILLCGSEVWNPYRGYYFPTWNKTEVERVHLQFLKRLIGVLTPFDMGFFQPSVMGGRA